MTLFDPDEYSEPDPDHDYHVLRNPDENRIGKYQRPGDASETQRWAAMAVYPATGTKRRLVLDAIARAGERGRTDEELQEELHMNPSTQRPRRVELVEGGWVTKSGRYRRTHASGQGAVVWVLTPPAEEKLNGAPRGSVRPTE